MTRSTKKKCEKIDWDETCSKCIHGSDKPSVAKGKCTHKDPDTMFDAEHGYWVCFSFVRRWETKEDLKKARK